MCLNDYTAFGRPKKCSALWSLQRCWKHETSRGLPWHLAFLQIPIFLPSLSIPCKPSPTTLNPNVLNNPKSLHHQNNLSSASLKPKTLKPLTSQKPCNPQNQPYPQKPSTKPLNPTRSSMSSYIPTGTRLSPTLKFQTSYKHIPKL